MSTSRALVVALQLLVAVSTLAESKTRIVRPRPSNPSSGCSAVSGVANIFRSTDGGQTFSRNAQPSAPATSYGIVVLEDTPEVIVAVVDTKIYDSIDKGCHWTLRYAITTPTHHPIRAVAATEGRAYIWSDEVELRYDHGTVTPMTRIAPLGAFGVDPGNREHVRGFAVGGPIWDSFDGGQSWTRQGTAPFNPVLGGAFDPSDFNHNLVYTSHGLSETRNAGGAWTTNTSFNRSICSAEFVRHSPNVVWLNLVVRKGTDSLYRSDDGGKKFSAIGQTPDIENGVCLPVTAHPFDSNRAVIAFGPMFLFDASSKTVTRGECCARLITRVTYSPVDRDFVLVFALD